MSSDHVTRETVASMTSDLSDDRLREVAIQAGMKGDIPVAACRRMIALWRRAHEIADADKTDFGAALAAAEIELLAGGTA